jgi:hypothetical protein
MLMTLRGSWPRRYARAFQLVCKLSEGSLDRLCPLAVRSEPAPGIKVTHDEFPNSTVSREKTRRAWSTALVVPQRQCGHGVVVCGLGALQILLRLIG